MMGQDDDDPWNDEIDERTENDRLWKVWPQVQFFNLFILRRVLLTPPGLITLFEGLLLNYKRPQDSYAYPDQSKGNKTNQKTFFHGKKLF